MKKFIASVIAFFAVFACLFISACDKNPVKADENTVFITAEDKSFDFEDKTLIDFMNHLQDNGKLTFEVSEGMVTMVNGKYQTANSYWMLYTSDADNSNEAWGTFEHEDKIYGSAMFGVEELPIKEGCVYVLAYQSFAF